MATVIEQRLVEQLARRMAVRMGVLGTLGFIGARAARPHPAWIAAGAIWALYELATNEPELDVSRMQANIRDDVWDAEDMVVFRQIFLQMQAAFLASSRGRTAERNGERYILIPRQIMPMIASVDLVGMSRFGQQLIYDRANRHRRRRAATAGRGRVGMMTLTSGLTVPGSWEEYPFAVTYAPGRPGAHVGPVPLAENWSQGGLIAAAKLFQNIRDGHQVVAHVV